MKFIKNKNILIVLLAVFSISTLFYFKDSNNAYAAKTNLPLNQLQAFSEVYLKIKQNYVQSVSDKELFDLSLIHI